MNVVAIVNPLSGAGADPDAAARRVRLLEERFASERLAAAVFLTERRHHATELARDAVGRGASLVIAWGGDGTINEVASIVAASGRTMGVIPAGSGNGFARELGLPSDPHAALDVILRGRDTLIDVGELDGRLFFNIAGIGVDAVIAEAFNKRALGRRGMGPYVAIGLREAFRYRAVRYRIVLDGEDVHSSALLVAFANGREYGNGIRLAPHARLDDGKLEAVVVEDRHPFARLWGGRHLFRGTTHLAARITLRSIQQAEVYADAPIQYHLDGETGVADRHVSVRIHPARLRMRVPANQV
ncbi:MAG: diacylglycerol kinase family lipid kinase [Acidobacteria bacterium]|nr:diacylglycerol kinase family lipid kinase [Acidobacteriota bacterium]